MIAGLTPCFHEIYRKNSPNVVKIIDFFYALVSNAAYKKKVR